jgi:CRISPR/Cas system-associated exonuclease Cas4 (RecB family)
MIQPKYHQSEVNTYLKCGKMWEFRYALGIKIPPRSAFTVGSAVDRAVSVNLEQKIHSGEDLSAEEVLDQFSTEFDERSYETDWKDDDPGKQKDIGAALTWIHHKHLAPGISPETVQESFTIETDAGFALGGTMDLTELSGSVVDTKTSRVQYKPDAVSTSIQAVLYDFAYEVLRGKPAKEFRFDVLVKPTRTQTARVQQVASVITLDNREWLFETIHQVHRAIQGGVALPAPEGSWYCSPKWCGYWNQCKGKKK